MTTINYPSGGIPLNYLISLQIRTTSSCSSTSTSQPSGTILAAETVGTIPNSYVNIAGGVCISLDTNKGSVIYYFVNTCKVDTITQI